MVIYKAYHEKYGWSRDYKRGDNTIEFNFGDGKGYVGDWDNKKNRLSIGFTLLSDDYYKNDKKKKREGAISELFDEDFLAIYTDHYYIYPKTLVVDYMTLENPLLLVKYENGIFHFVFEYDDDDVEIPLSYINEFDNQFIDVDLLKSVGNIHEHSDEIEKLKYARH